MHDNCWAKGRQFQCYDILPLLHFFVLSCRSKEQRARCTFVLMTKQEMLVICSEVIPWCSGYHVSLTHSRSPVRSRAESLVFFFFFFFPFTGCFCFFFLFFSVWLGVVTFVFLYVVNLFIKSFGGLFFLAFTVAQSLHSYCTLAHVGLQQEITRNIQTLLIHAIKTVLAPKIKIYRIQTS